LEPLHSARDLVTLEFRCLGLFAFHGSCRWRAAPARARGGEFLAYLASHSRSPILRTTLAEALWPHLNPEQSAHRLHLAVSGARAALRVELPEINPIVFVEDSYGWHSSVQITSDARRLEQCFNDGSPAAFSEGISVYAGQFLPAEQADWVTPMRVRYEHMYVTMLETLASAALEAGDYARATNFGLELIEVDGANERATQLVMVSSAKAGRRGFALATFAKLERYLRKWLGVEPMSETSRLRVQILQDEIGSTAVYCKAPDRGRLVTPGAESQRVGY
jgi:DNA-binding SARP family transcriptional activator